MRDKTALDSGSRQGSNEVALRQRQRERERERERESEREGIARRARSRAKRERCALHVLLRSRCARDSIADYFAISDKSRSYRGRGVLWHDVRLVQAEILRLIYVRYK